MESQEGGEDPTWALTGGPWLNETSGNLLNVTSRTGVEGGWAALAGVGVGGNLLVAGVFLVRPWNRTPLQVDRIVGLLALTGLATTLAAVPAHLYTDSGMCGREAEQGAALPGRGLARRAGVSLSLSRVFIFLLSISSFLFSFLLFSFAPLYLLSLAFLLFFLLISFSVVFFSLHFSSFFPFTCFVFHFLSSCLFLFFSSPLLFRFLFFFYFLLSFLQFSNLFSSLFFLSSSITVILSLFLLI